MMRNKHKLIHKKIKQIASIKEHDAMWILVMQGVLQLEAIHVGWKIPINYDHIGKEEVAEVDVLKTSGHMVISKGVNWWCVSI